MIRKLFSLINTALCRQRFKIVFQSAAFAAFMVLAVLAIYIAASSTNLIHILSLNKNLEQEYVQHSPILLPITSSSSSTIVPDPTGHYPIGMLPDFYNLYDRNSDIKGWITIPKTVVNYPVLQSTDNSYYLNRDFNKAADNHGSLFLDYRNQINVPSQNMIIYGHNMKDGQMFQSIVNFQFTDFYKTSSIITFNTVYRAYLWKVFAAFIVNADPKDGYVFNYLVTSFPTNDAFKSFIKEVRDRSLLNVPSVDVEPGDTILTLSTCYYSSNDARFVVVSRRVRPDEDLKTGPATRNKNALSATSPMNN